MGDGFKSHPRYQFRAPGLQDLGALLFWVFGPGGKPLVVQRQSHPRDQLKRA